MHRSGTSLVAELVGNLGCSIPGTALPTIDAINAHGFWESKEVVDINERLLEAARLKWFHVCPVGHFFKAASPDVLCELTEEIRLFLDKEIKNKGDLLIKDPRLCLLLPIWLSVAAEMNCDVKVVFVSRHPAAVAGSVRARDGFSQFSGHLLWLYYFFSVFGDGENKNALLLSYESILENQSNCRSLISEYLEKDSMPLGVWEKAVDSTLQRNFDSDFPDKGYIYNLAKAVYAGVADLGAKSVPENVLAMAAGFERFVFENNDFVYALNESNNQLSATKGEMVAIGEMHSYALSVIREKDALIDECVGQRDEFQSRVAALEDWLKESEEQQSVLDEVRRQLVDMSQRVVGCEAYILECEGRIFDLEFSLAGFVALRKRQAELQNIMTRRNSEALHNTEYIKKLAGRINELRKSVAEFDKLKIKLTNLESALHQNAVQLEQRNSQLKAAEGRISELDQVFVGQRSNYLSALSVVDELEKKLAARNDDFFVLADELSLLRSRLDKLLSWRFVRVIDGRNGYGVDSHD